MFFTLHDFDSTNQWSSNDILRTYGLFDESAQKVAQSEKDNVVRRVLEIFDADRSGTVSYAEFTVGYAKGAQLPDFGLGPGHHGDDEYEYEIHHFEKYHGEDAKEEDLTHPEDIEHFRKHDKMEEEQEKWEERSKGIVEDNIPTKFKRIRVEHAA